MTGQRRLLESRGESRGGGVTLFEYTIIFVVDSRSPRSSARGTSHACTPGRTRIPRLSALVGAARLGNGWRWLAVEAAYPRVASGADNGQASTPNGGGRPTPTGGEGGMQRYHRWPTHRERLDARFDAMTRGRSRRVRSRVLAAWAGGPSRTGPIARKRTLRRHILRQRGP